MSFLASGIRLALAAVLLVSGRACSVCRSPAFAPASCCWPSPAAPAAGGSTLRGKPEQTDIGSVLKTLWPSSWRVGLQLMSVYLTVNANTAICLHAFGLAANAKYGLSVQLFNIIASMASVWLFVKWPLIIQARAKEDWPRSGSSCLSESGCKT